MEGRGGIERDRQRGTEGEGGREMEGRGGSKGIDRGMEGEGGRDGEERGTERGGREERRKDEIESYAILSYRTSVQLLNLKTNEFDEDSLVPGFVIEIEKISPIRNCKLQLIYKWSDCGFSNHILLSINFQCRIVLAVHLNLICPVKLFEVCVSEFSLSNKCSGTNFVNFHCRRNVQKLCSRASAVKISMDCIPVFLLPNKCSNLVARKYCCQNVQGLHP